jgi:hypothetical protein
MLAWRISNLNAPYISNSLNTHIIQGLTLYIIDYQYLLDKRAPHCPIIFHQIKTNRIDNLEWNTLKTKLKWWYFIFFTKNSTLKNGKCIGLSINYFVIIFLLNLLSHCLCYFCCCVTNELTNQKDRRWTCWAWAHHVSELWLIDDNKVIWQIFGVTGSSNTEAFLYYFLVHWILHPVLLDPWEIAL